MPTRSTRSPTIIETFLSSMGGKVAATLLVPTGLVIGAGDLTMVATIPTEIAPIVIALLAVVAVIFGFGVMLRRYVEHNDKDGEDRGTNKLKVKFVVGTVIAAAVVTALCYFLAPIVTAWAGVADPAWYDYVLIMLIPELLITIGAVLIACEGITFTAKWIEQKAEEFKDAWDKLSEEDKKKALAALKVETKPEETNDPGDGLA